MGFFAWELCAINRLNYNALDWSDIVSVYNSVDTLVR